ncbi:MAG: Methyl sulfide methyltransferase-associated sensor [Candidatus Methanogaster sp.]|nr:MAG: Methyl sulfide methyltransferase-associated sensor [ANME-2 cluster archaeon]
MKETERDSLSRKSCDALLDARGYEAVWLGLLGDDRTFDLVVGSGFREDVSYFSDRVAGGDYPPCIRNALSNKEQVMVIDMTDVCVDCFFKDVCPGRAAAVIRVEHADRFFGLLVVSLAPGVAVDGEDKELLAEVASDIGIALHNIEMRAAQKAADDALLKSEGKYRSLMDDVLDTSDVGIFILDDEFKVVWINHSTEKYFGLNRKDVIGKDKRQLIHKRIKDIFEDPETFKEKVFATYDNNIYLENFECHVLPGEGRKERWLEHWSQPIRSGLYKGGRIEHYSDITGRKAVEDALLESERKYREFFRTSRDPVFITTKAGILVESNDALAEVFGYETPDKLVKIEVPEHYENPGDRKRFNRIIEQDGFAKEFPINLRKKDGSILNTLITATVIKDRGGNVTGFQGTIRDITKQKRAEDALKEGEEKYRALFETAKDAIFVNEGDGKFMDANSAACELLGYSKEELLKLSNKEIDADSRGYEAFLKVRNGQMEEAVFEVNQRRKDGTFIPVEISGKSFEIGGSKLFLAIARNITERKAADGALKESEIRYKHLYSMVRLMCDNMPDLIWTKDLDGKFVFVNEACCDILLNARDTDEPIGKGDIYFASREREAHPENPDYHTFGETCARSDRIVMETKKPQRFDEFGNLKGEFIYIDVYKAPFWDGEDNLLGTVGCARVVTKERLAEEQIKRSLQEKEVMLREIHHRVKNNLQVVSSLLNMQARNAMDKNTIAILSEARDRIKTMSLIHSQLYDGSDLSEINMKSFIDQLLGQLLGSYPVPATRITCVVRVDDHPFPISVAVPVGLIINELLSNALKHAFDGMDEGKIEIMLTASEGGGINLMVRDDGIGLPPGLKINATKTLGLRLVKILTEDQLQGRIDVSSDRGAIFGIKFDICSGGSTG